MRRKSMTAMMILVVFLLFVNVGYAIDESPPTPLSVDGFIFKEDGSPVGRGTSITIMNVNNLQIEETQTGIGFPTLTEYDNAFTSSLSYEPGADHTIKVIARAGDYYGEKEVVADSNRLEVNLTLSYRPAPTESEIEIINIIEASKKEEKLGEETVENKTQEVLPTETGIEVLPQKELPIVSYLLIAILIIAILGLLFLFSIKEKKGKVRKRRKKTRKALVLIVVFLLGAFALSSALQAEQITSVLTSVKFISGFLQPTAMISKDVGMAVPQPVDVHGFVFHSNGTAVGNCTNVNATVRFLNGTIFNIEQTCTGQGFPPASQFYPQYTASLSAGDSYGDKTVNVTAWNATHQGKNSSAAAADLELNITLSEFLPESNAPAFYNNQSQTVSVYDPAQYSNFSINWTDDTRMAVGYLEANFSGSLSNISMVNNTYGKSVVYTYNSTPLAAGTYQYRFVGVDIFDNSNATDILYFTISKADNPVNLYLNGTLNSNRTITYPSASNATAAVYVGTVYLYRDEVLRASGASPQSEIAQLAAAEYAYKVNATGNQNFSDNSSVTYYLTVNRAASSVSVTFSPSSSETYGTTTTAFCNITTGDSVAFLTIDRNGTGVVAGAGNQYDTQTLGAGDYDYDCYYSQSENYTASSSLDNILSIAKADPSANLKMELNGTEGDASVIYPAATNATGYATLADNQDLTFTLYRNDTGLATTDPASDVNVLGGGAYSYVYNTTGGANYTAGTSATRTLTVNKTGISLFLYFNGTEGDIAVAYNATVNITLDSSPQGKGAQIRTNYSDGGDNLWNSDPTPIEDIRNYSVNGTWNFTGYFAGDQNYTSNSTTHYLTVYPTDLEPPKWSNQSQESDSPEEGSSNELSAYWTDNIQLTYAWLSTNETGNWTNTTYTAISGIGNWSNFSWSNSSLSAGVNVAWKIYANDTGGNENVTDTMNFTIAAAPVAPPPAPPAAPPAPPAPPAVAAPTFDSRMSKLTYSEAEDVEIIFNVTNPGSAINIYAEVFVTKAGSSYKEFRTTKTIGEDSSLEWTEIVETVECSTPYGTYSVAVKWYYSDGTFIEEDMLSYGIARCKMADITKLQTDKSSYEPNETMHITTEVKNTGNQDIEKAKLELFTCLKGECETPTKIKEFDEFPLSIGEAKENLHDHILEGYEPGDYELRATVSEGGVVLDTRMVEFTVVIVAVPVDITSTLVGVAAAAAIAAIVATYLRRRMLLLAPKIIVIVRNKTKVKFTLTNRTKHRFKNVVVEDRIPGKPKIENITPRPLKTIRTAIYTKIVWKLDIKPKEKRKFSYKIKAKFKRLPKAKIKSFEKVVEKKPKAKAKKPKAKKKK